MAFQPLCGPLNEYHFVFAGWLLSFVVQEAQQWSNDMHQWRKMEGNLLDVLLIVMLVLASVVRYMLSTPITTSHEGASSVIELIRLVAMRNSSQPELSDGNEVRDPTA